MAADCKRDTTTTRVLLWSVPRAVSTAFLKCMTFVENSTVWHEPYLWANLCGPDGSFHLSGDIKPGSLDLYHKDTGGIGYDAIDHPFSWVKEQLEADYPNTKLLFVKEMVAGIDGHYDVIPDGFRHSFLIRHPLKVFDSVRRMFHRESPPENRVPLTEMPLHDVPKGYFFMELRNLLEHVKEYYEPNPLIIDADDLLANPKGIMEAYCRELGISYNDSLLQWPAGEDAMYKKWKIQKEVVILHQLGGVHKETFNSEGFGEPTQMPKRSDLTEDVRELADASMGNYNAMYEQRLKV